jgi:hypothetical protein
MELGDGSNQVQGLVCLMTILCVSHHEALAMGALFDDTGKIWVTHHRELPWP